MPERHRSAAEGTERNMINIFEVAETNQMIEKENLDVRTITLGISLLDCISADLEEVKENIYRKIYGAAKKFHGNSVFPL